MTLAIVIGYVRTLDTCRTALSESIEGKFLVKKNVSQEEKLMAASYSCPSRYVSSALDLCRRTQALTR